MAGIRMTSKKGLSVLFLLVLGMGMVLAPASKSPAAPTALGDTTGRYLRYMSEGEYSRALDLLGSWTVQTADEYVAEVNLFRIEEIARDPHYLPNALRILENIDRRWNERGGSVHFHDRLNGIRLGILCRMGRAEEAARGGEALGYVRRFWMLGPFVHRGEDEFDKVRMNIGSFAKDFRCRGKVSFVEWFPVEAGPDGSLNMRDLYSDVRDSLYVLTADIACRKAGWCRLYLGKEGSTDVWIDDNKVFSNRRQHGYYPAQYRTDVFLSRGVHRLVLKTGNVGRNRLRISLRVVDADGVPLVSRGKLEERIPVGVVKKGPTQYFSSLNHYLQKPDREEVNFIRGYLLSRAGLNSEKDQEAIHAFARVRDSSQFFPAALLYGVFEEGSREKREAGLHTCLRCEPRNIRALEELAQYRIRDGFLYEANPLIDAMNKVNPDSAIPLWLQGSLFMKMEWDYEAERVADRLDELDLHCDAHKLRAAIYMNRGKYRKAASHLHELYRCDRGDGSILDNLLTALEKSGQYETAVDLISGTLRHHPRNVFLRLRLAGIAANTGKQDLALAALSSALKISPRNPEALIRTGLFYHKRGKTFLARSFLQRALEQDPNNFSLKQYYTLLFPKTDELDKFRIKDDLDNLVKKAQAYRDEPAVCLLDEKAIRVQEDGSFEKEVRKVYKINDTSLIERFSRQYIVINPKTDYIEKFECVVHNGSNRVESREKHVRSLSDPESRLYYDLEAHIIPVSSLQKGSILTFRYHVKSRSGEAFKNYYGEKITLGGDLRVMTTNIIMSFPESRHIYCHVKGIDGKSILYEKAGQRDVYQVRLLNSEGLKKEPAMPPSGDLLPAVYFTSFKNWDELYRWYHSLLANRIMLSDEMRKVARSLGKGFMKPDEKIRRIYNHVNGVVRYVGFEFGIGGIQPRRSDDTYHSRMGDCKDISLVLVAMLREAGLDARLTLLRTADKGETNTDVPYLGDFNHAICYVNINGGIFLDGTAKHCGFMELPDDDYGVNALVLSDRGYNFINTGTGKSDYNLESVMTEVYLMSDGDATVKRRLIKQGGVFAPSARYGLLNREKMLQNLSRYWNDMYTGSRIKNLLHRSLSVDAPVVYEYDAEIPSFAQRLDGQLLFRTTLFPSNMYRSYGMLKTRKHPLRLANKRETHDRVIYHLPKGYKVYRMPDNGTLSTDNYEARFKYSLDEKMGTVALAVMVKYRGKTVSTRDYQNFREFTRFISKKENEIIVLIRDGH